MKGKKIVVGITGSIAAYKTAQLVRLLVKAGAEVRVVMTDAADAPSAGSYGDSAVVLAALLARPPMHGPFLMTMTDPAAARACAAAGPGATLRLRVGGAFQPLFFAPVEIEARVLAVLREG